MSNIINISNNNQNNYQQVIVNNVPVANPEDLKFSLTQNSTIFGNDIILDQVFPPMLYHGGNPIVDPGQIQIHSCDIVNVNVTDIETLSGNRTKGIYELRNSLEATLINIISGSTTQLEIDTPFNLPVGSYIEIHAPSGGNINGMPFGVYKIVSTASSPTYTVFDIDFDSSLTTLSYTGIINIRQFEYFWDEVYTTPLRVYASVDTTVSNPNLGEFKVINNNSNQIVVPISDPNIVPKIGDSLVIQRFFSTYPVQVGSSTDGFNNFKNYSQSETYVFKIENVSAINNPLPLPTPYTEYTLTLDKSFKPILTETYMLVLLNREGSTVNRELLTDTWQLKEVNRQQLLGDPYEYTGVLDFPGRTNYLNYRGAELLGVKELLSGIINPEKTPFIILDYSKEIKDRIYSGLGKFEIHLPCVLIDGEKTPVILTNIDPFNTGSWILTDVNGVNKYSALYLKYSNNTARVGWVFYDLRIAVIDDAELATALSYNSNRNYTLAPLQISNANNASRPTPTNPVLISNIDISSKIITTVGNHNLETGDQVIINGVLGTAEANTSPGSYYYVNVLSNNTFELFVDNLLTIPVNITNQYLGGGIVAGTRLPYEYFITYRLKGKHYATAPYSKVVPFNFSYQGAVSSNPSADVTIQFNALTHLIDVNNSEGFDADHYEVIIGKYTQSQTNLYTPVSIEDVVVLGNETLKDLSGVQNPTHSKTYRKSYYDSLVSLANSLTNNNPANPKYDLYNVNSQKIYQVTNLPETLYTGNGDWLLGIVSYQEAATKYTATFEFTIPANKWNSTLNPSYKPGEPLIPYQLISEIELLVKDMSGSLIDTPYIYSKVNPPIKKTNTNDLIISIQLDF
jgi:hypothetical protein